MASTLHILLCYLVAYFTKMITGCCIQYGFIPSENIEKKQQTNEKITKTHTKSKQNKTNHKNKETKKKKKKRKNTLKSSICKRHGHATTIIAHSARLLERINTIFSFLFSQDSPEDEVIR